MIAMWDLSLARPFDGPICLTGMSVPVRTTASRASPSNMEPERI